VTTLAESVEYAERLSGALRRSLPADAHIGVGPRMIHVTAGMRRSHALFTGDEAEDRARVKALIRHFCGPTRWERLKRVLARAACW
jgi:hypothetical protein